MEQPKIIVNTTMSKEDYRKFLYIAAFKRNKAVLPLLGLIALLGGIILGLDSSGHFNLTRFLVGWVALFALVLAVVVFKVEMRAAQRVKTDKTGTFDSINTLKFYDDRMAIENKALKATGELKYGQFYALMESKDYFIFYLNQNQASLVRKKDIDDPGAFREFIVEKYGGRYKRI